MNTAPLPTQRRPVAATRSRIRNGHRITCTSHPVKGFPGMTTTYAYIKPLPSHEGPVVERGPMMVADMSDALSEFDFLFGAAKVRFSRRLQRAA